ncbi:MAG TPA: VWA domain-containing protein [Bryobacteraceae bacterium]|nr:VWA domain-containing protein [Bryobacteraceae bacterium]
MLALRNLGFLVLAATALAQAPPAAQDDVPLYRADARLVLLHASVVDKNGKLLTNIPQSAFKILEDGVEQPIRLFRREDVPVSMGIIVDNSGSMTSKRTRVAAAALEMVKQSNPEDEVFIVNFNDDSHFDQPLTNDVKKLQSALARMEARGGTAMRDALSKSINYVKKNGKKDKKVLVVITDGNDNSSDLTLEQVVRQAQNSEVLIYAIGLLNEEEAREARAAKKALKALVDASGGLDYYPKSTSDVQEITPRVAHEIRNQYILGYTSSNQALDGSFRQIKVTVSGFGRPTVRTRNGYYATPTARIDRAIDPFGQTLTAQR